MSVVIDLSGKVAVVTGASGGIGQAVMGRLGAAGAMCAALDFEIDPSIYHVDVSSEESVREAFEGVLKDMGAPDILVNCAGITADGLMIGIPGDPDRPPMSTEQYMRVIGVNQLGTFLCMQEAALLMTAASKEGGAFVNLSSLSSAGNIGQINYSASKAAVLAMTVAAAGELARYKIRVNAIAPGPVDTAMMSTVPDPIRQSYIKRTPLRKEGQPVDIADAVLYLVSPMSSHVTGEVLTVSGGLRF